MRLLNENVRDYAITMLDIDGRLIDWNAGAERMFGYTAARRWGSPARCCSRLKIARPACPSARWRPPATKAVPTTSAGTCARMARA